MLGDDPGLARFVDAIARRCGGRVFTPDIGRLGEYVVADYLRGPPGPPVTTGPVGTRGHRRRGWYRRGRLCPRAAPTAGLPVRAGRPRAPDRRSDGQPDHRRSPGGHRRLLLHGVRPGVRGGGGRLASAGAWPARGPTPSPCSSTGIGVDDRSDALGRAGAVCDRWSRTSPTGLEVIAGRRSARSPHDGGLMVDGRPAVRRGAGHARPTGSPAADRRRRSPSASSSVGDYEPVLALTATFAHPDAGTSTVPSSPTIDVAGLGGRRRLAPRRRRPGAGGPLDPRSSPPTTWSDPERGGARS